MNPSWKRRITVRWYRGSYGYSTSTSTSAPANGKADAPFQAGINSIHLVCHSSYTLTQVCIILQNGFNQSMRIRINVCGILTY